MSRETVSQLAERLAELRRNLTSARIQSDADGVKEISAEIDSVREKLDKMGVK